MFEQLCSGRAAAPALHCTRIFAASGQNVVGEGRSDVERLLRELDLQRLELEQQAEQLREARVAEARSASILDTVPDAVVTTDAVGRIESFNRAAEELFGYAEAEILGRNMSMLMPSPHRERHGVYVRRRAESCGEGARAETREVVGLRKDGKTMPVQVTVGQWHDRDEPKFTAIFRDVTERQRSEQELRASEARFRQIAEHIDDVFVVHERGASGIGYASPSFEAVWGRSLAELYAAGMGWIDWIHPADRVRVRDAYDYMLKGDPFDEELRILRPDGGVRWVRARGFAVADATGRIARDIGVIQDVTSERALEDELRQAQKLEALGVLASGVAHDFNNVLQGILGCIDTVREEEELSADARQYLDQAAEAARRGGNLASQLMAFTRKQVADPEPVELDAVIRDLADLLERLVTEQVAVDISCDGGGAAVMADPAQIEQILMNLAANARDAMVEGGVLSIRTDAIEPGDTAHIDRGLSPDRRYVRLVVSDSGKGMDEHTRARMFEPFFTTKRVGEGTGIGLSTVFAVTRQLGGHIDVDSAPGAGTSVTLYLPCCKLRPTARAVAVSDLPRFTGTALVIEDESLVRMTVRHYLTQLGFDVLEGSTADEAQRICEEHRGELDVLVTDVILPGLQGPKLAAQLRERFPTLSVLFMSANPDAYGARTDLSPAMPVLQKPFGREELARQLERLVPQHRD